MHCIWLHQKIALLNLVIIIIISIVIISVLIIAILMSLVQKWKTPTRIALLSVLIIIISVVIITVVIIAIFIHMYVLCLKFKSEKLTLRAMRQ